MFTLAGEQVTFVVDPAESAVLVEARSSVGPIVFGSMAVTGRIEAVLQNGTVDTGQPTAAELVIPVASLTSGNALYDSEIRSRLDARRFPHITAALCSLTALSRTRFDVTGNLTIQETTRQLSGGLELSLAENGNALLTGSQVVDIRDFAIELPRMLMLRIYPDVTVRFQIRAVKQTADQEPKQVTGQQT